MAEVDPPVKADWRCPDAEVVLTAEQIKNRELWLAERKKGIAGTDLAALFGEAKYGNNEFSVWLEKTNRAPDPEAPSEAMEWGTALEDVIAQTFAERHGIQVRRAGLMRSRIAPELLVSVDRLTSDGGGLECKNHNGWLAKQYPGDALDDPFPRAFYWQMICALAATGRSHWWLAALVGGNNLKLRRIDRSDPQVAEDIAKALELVPKWWFRHVVEDEAPAGFEDEELDAPEGRVEASFGPAVLDMVATWRDLAEQANEIDEAIKEIRAELLAEIGDGKLLTVMDVPYVQKIVRKGNLTFKKAKFAKAHPEIDIDEFYERGKGSSYVQLVKRGESE